MYPKGEEKQHMLLPIAREMDTLCVAFIIPNKLLLVDVEV